MAPLASSSPVAVTSFSRRAPAISAASCSSSTCAESQVWEDCLPGPRTDEPRPGPAGGGTPEGAPPILDFLCTGDERMRLGNAPRQGVVSGRLGVVDGPPVKRSRDGAVRSFGLRSVGGDGGGGVAPAAIFTSSRDGDGRTARAAAAAAAAVVLLGSGSLECTGSFESRGRPVGFFCRGSSMSTMAMPSSGIVGFAVETRPWGLPS